MRILILLLFRDMITKTTMFWLAIRLLARCGGMRRILHLFIIEWVARRL